MPDESVAPTIADALQHRDPVMARALTLFEASADAPRRQGE
jgi:hypothetical protein